MDGRLLDPNYELTDDELMDLSRQAFADVEKRHAAALAKLHAQIAEQREKLRGECAIES